MPTGYISEPTTELGVRLRQLRTRAGLTQPELAELLDTKSNRISDWEIGKHTPTLRLLRKIAEVYGITVSGLLRSVM